MTKQRSLTKPVKSTQGDTCLAAASSTNKNSKTIVIFLNFLLMLLVLLLLISGGWLYWYTDKHFAWHSQQINLLNEQVADLTQININWQQLETQQTQQQKQLTDFLLIIKKQKNYITKLKQQINQISLIKSDNLVLRHTQYLIQLAGYKLWLENDIDTSIKLLQASDRQLVRLNKENTLPLRQALAQDISMLQNIPSIDQAGIALTISNLIPIVERLPLINVAPDKAAIEVKTNDNDTYYGWLANLQQVWQVIKNNLITVQRNPEPWTAKISLQEKRYLKVNIQQQLILAQFALYRYQSTVYQQALTQILDWLPRYFAKQNSTYQQLHQSIVKLVQININFKLPEALTSAKAVDLALANIAISNIIDTSQKMP